MKKKRILFILLIFCLVFFIGCKPDKLCFKDEDCVVSGCSGEICANKPMASPCLWKPEYECLKYSECKCINFQCDWKNTTTYFECLQNVSSEKVKDIRNMS